jgi:Na+/H+ antiporter NhaC
MPTTTPYEFKDHRLYTGDFLAQKLLASQENDTRDSAGGSPGIMVKLFPTIVFILAAVLSFATGTSYGTMGILLPIVVTLAHALLGMQGERIAATNPILLASVGSVLAGAVFGDHCSPISDTTILSSQSCVCDHISHVVTQFPYALLVAIVIVIFGTLPLGWGVSVWLLLPLQVVVLYFVLNTAGQNVEQFHNDQ